MEYTNAHNIYISTLYISIHLTSGIPDPQAYGAKEWTKSEASVANNTAHNTYNKYLTM